MHPSSPILDNTYPSLPSSKRSTNMPLGFGNKSSAVDKAETSHEEYPRAPSPNRVYVPGSAEEKALVRKIDRTLIPLVWVMYILSYLDRYVLLSFALSLSPHI